MEPSIPGPTAGLRVKRNDSGSVTPARLGSWRPQARVSVVVPAYGGQDKLDLTLAALSAQTYPAELLDVVVVDDGSDPPLRLPRVRPAATRLLPNRDGRWGIAAAVDTAVAACSGEIVVRLDSDVVPAAGHVEAHARWHALADYFVVVGKLAFADVDAAAMSPDEVVKAVEAGAVPSLFAGCDVSDDWEIALVRESGGTVTDPVGAFRIANGATISFTRAMYEACGGMDTGLRLGSDTELGYRLAQHGAVFIADAEAEVWHLGYSQMKSRRGEGKRYRRPFAANRIPALRHLRTQRGMSWEVPYVQAVVDVAGARLEPARATVASLLGGTLADIEVVLTGPWSDLTEDRVAPLEDRLLDLRLIRETFRGDARVRLAEHAPVEIGSVPFRLTLTAGATMREDGLVRLLAHADERGLGRIELAVPSRVGPLAVRLDRVAALARAERLRGPDESAEELIDQLWGIERTEAREWFEDGSMSKAVEGHGTSGRRAPLLKAASLPQRALGRLRRALHRR